MKHAANRLSWKKKKTIAHYLYRTTPFSSSSRHNKVSLLLLRPTLLCCSYNNNRRHPCPGYNKNDDTTTTTVISQNRFKSIINNNTRKACYHSSSSSFGAAFGVNSKKNTKRKDTKVLSSLTASSASFSSSDRSSSSSSSSSSNRNHNDDCDLDGYRKALINEYYHNNEGLWRSDAIQKENEHTKRSIITDNDHPKNRLLYEEIYDELVGILREDEEKIGAVPESGPTGKFSYYTKDDSASEGRRIYYRKPNNNNDDPTTAIPQTVWDISFRDQQLRAMSLSVDEALVAILVVDENEQEQQSSSPRKGTTRILLRHIETGKQTELDLPSHNNNIVSIEFGPSVVAEQQQEETKDNDSKSQQQHSLYYVTTDRLGRPCTVWACAVCEQDFVQPSSILVPTKPPVRLYHSPEPDVMVDIQRTKGCRYAAIQATTKTSNEIYLSRCFWNSDSNNDSNEENDGNTSHKKETEEPTIIRYRTNNNETLFFSLELVRRKQPGVVYHVDVGTDDDVFLLACDSAAAAAAPERQSDDHVDDHNHNELGPELALFETSISRLPLLSTNTNNNVVCDSSSAFGTRIAGGTSFHTESNTNHSVPDGNDKNKEEYIIADMDLFRTFVALYETSTRDGRARIRIVPRQQQQQHDTAAATAQEPNKNDDRNTIVPIPGDFVGIVNPGGNIHYESRSLRFSLETPAHPGRTHEYCTVSHELKRLDDDATDRDDHSSNITVDRVLVPNPSDGTQVPLSLVYRNDNSNDIGGSDGILPKNKIVLVGYGSYGQPLGFSYDPTVLPLLRRGYAFAYAHVRGGGELGKSWYHGGRLCNKPNSIDDFLACARFLVGKNNAPSSVGAEEPKKTSSVESSSTDNDVSSSSSSLSSWLLSFFSTTPSIQQNHKSNSDNSETGSSPSPSPSSSCSSSDYFDNNNVLLTAKGYSAGGVVIGGAANREPSLFRGVVLTNAFLDVYATMKNESLFLTEHEHEEYGNPSLDPLAAECIASYCPVSNVYQQTNMPSFLVVGSYDDEQVPFWNALLYARALRRIHPVPGNVCLHTERRGGHQMHGTRLSIAALESTFIIKKDNEEIMQKKHEGG